MPDNSFDVVSQIEMPEVSNAIQQAMKEVTTRYDLKDSKSKIELNEKDKKLTLSSADDFKLKAVTEILNQKLVKRGVPIRNLTYGTINSAAGSSVKQEVTLQSGILNVMRSGLPGSNGSGFSNPFRNFPRKGSPRTSC